MKKFNLSFTICVILCFIAPPAIIFCLVGMLRASIYINSYTPPIIFFDLTKDLSISDYLSLHIGCAGVIATIFLGFAIFKLNQDKEEKEKQESIKAAACLLSSGLDYIFETIETSFKSLKSNSLSISRFTYSSKRIRCDDAWLVQLASLREQISPKEFATIHAFLQEIKSYQGEQNILKLYNLIFVPFFKDAFLPPHILKEITSADDLLNGEIRTAISTIKSLYSDKKSTDRAERKIYYGKHRLFIEETIKDKNIRYCIYDIAGEKIVDGFFDSEKNFTGFMTTFEGDRISEFGTYNNNVMINGTICDAICDENGYFKRKTKRTFEEIPANEFQDNKPHEFGRIADFKYSNKEATRISEIRFIKLYY